MPSNKMRISAQISALGEAEGLSQGPPEARVAVASMDCARGTS